MRRMMNSWAGVQSQAQTVVVVGAGHNGLVAAGYMARAGVSVTVVEGRELVGGACVTEELVPGFRFSSAAVVLSLLWPKIVRELELPRFGLRYYRTGVDRIGIWENGRTLLLYPELDRQLAAVAAVSADDAWGLLRLGIDLRRFATLFEPTILRPPLSLDRLRLLFVGEDELLFQRFVLGSVEATLSRYFRSPELLGFFAFPGMVSVDAAPSSPGTAYVFAHHAVGGLDGELGAHGYVRGGMGGVTQALAASAQAAGASIITGVAVERILVADRRVVGVALADGKQLPASAVLSNADPARTMLRLVGPAELDPEFVQSVEQLDYGGSMARVHLALRELPRYEAAPHRGAGPTEIHSAFTLLGADLKRFARAHDAQRRGELPHEPVLEVTIPSAHDNTLAPAGAHTLTLGVMHIPRDLAHGTWESRREELGDLVVQRLATYAPNVPDAILARRVATPLDLEHAFGLTGGNIFQGAMTPAQLFAARPLDGWSNYRMPIQGLYLCGSGTHPGGAVSGAPGHNAAHALLADLAAGAMSRERWLELAAEQHRPPRVPSGGRLLRTLASRREVRWSMETLARRRFMRPVVRHLMSAR
jgi:phytoene dehydrogenase-like protein